MRLIDADALINEIKKDVEKSIEQDNKVEFFWLGYIAGLVISQPTIQPEPQWILCSERLPDVAQRVLLSGHGQVMVGMLHSFGKFSLEPTGISYVYPKDDIEAWMPLPKLYAERRTE